MYIDKSNECDRVYAIKFAVMQQQIDERNKLIDLIIEEYEYNDRINLKKFCEEKLRKDSCIRDCKACIEQYFEKLVEEVGD